MYHKSKGNFITIYSFLLTIFLAIITSGVSAQTKVTGSVLSSDGKPLVGATVHIEKLSLGTATNQQGQYVLEIPVSKVTNGGFNITAGYLGYNAETKPVNSTGNITVNFVLTENFMALKGVKVTALKTRATLLAETPASITVFKGKFIENIGANYLSDFIQEAPGVTTTQLDEAYMTVQIRGISSLSGDSPAGYYLDDIPFTFIGSPLVPAVNPFDLEQVEILRGPQGTLYGNGGEAGVVRILTKDAELSGTHVKLDLSGASTSKGGSDYGIQGAFNTPLIKDKLAIRLTGGYLDEGGFLTNNLQKKKNINEGKLSYFRGKINFQPNDQLSIRATYWMQKNDVGSNSLADDNFDHSTPYPEVNKNTLNLYNATFEYKFPKIHLYNSTSYSKLDATQNDGSSIFALSGTQLGQKAFNEEFRLNSTNDGPLNWLAGFYNWDGTFNQSTTVSYFMPDGSLLNMPYLSTRSTSRQFAGFGELSHKFADNRMQATVGLRYFSENRDLEDLLPSTIALLQALKIPAKRGTDYHAFSPKFNLAFNASKNALLYFTAANGFRSGFVQSGAFFGSAVAFGIPAPEYVNKENLWSYELGTKLSTTDKQLQVDAAVYYNDWSALIQSSSQIVTVGGQPTPIIYFLNAGKAGALGLDISTQYVNPMGLTLSLGGNINNSTYRDDTPVSIGAKKGDRISFVPKYTLSASAYYSHALSASLKGSIYGSVQQSAQRVDYNAGKEVKGDDITMFNLRMGVENKTWGIFLFGNNLTNEKGATYPSNILTYDTRLRPRTIGLNLKFNY